VRSRRATGVVPCRTISAGAPPNREQGALLYFRARRIHNVGGAPAQHSMSTLSPGGRIGPYEIDAQIGAGGMGEVYRARDTRLHRTVVIKILPSSLPGFGRT
jgi:serine/threonine protein kinase